MRVSISTAEKVSQTVKKPLDQANFGVCAFLIYPPIFFTCSVLLTLFWQALSKNVKITSGAKEVVSVVQHNAGSKSRCKLDAVERRIVLPLPNCRSKFSDTRSRKGTLITHRDLDASPSILISWSATGNPGYCRSQLNDYSLNCTVSHE